MPADLTVWTSPQNHKVLPHLPQPSSISPISSDSGSIVGWRQHKIYAMPHFGMDDLPYWATAFQGRICEEWGDAIPQRPLP